MKAKEKKILINNKTKIRNILKNIIKTRDQETQLKHWIICHMLTKSHSHVCVIILIGSPYERSQLYINIEK